MSAPPVGDRQKPRGISIEVTVRAGETRRDLFVRALLEKFGPHGLEPMQANFLGFRAANLSANNPGDVLTAGTKHTVVIEEQFALELAASLNARVGAGEGERLYTGVSKGDSTPLTRQLEVAALALEAFDLAMMGTFAGPLLAMALRRRAAALAAEWVVKESFESVAFRAIGKKPGEYLYTTTLTGQAKVAEGWLVRRAAPRDTAAQAAVTDGLEGAWDGSHLIPSRFGGSGGGENLTAATSRVNRSVMTTFENEVDRRLKAGEELYLHAEVRYGAATDRAEVVRYRLFARNPGGQPKSVLDTEINVTHTPAKPMGEVTTGKKFYSPGGGTPH